MGIFKDLQLIKKNIIYNKSYNNKYHNRKEDIALLRKFGILLSKKKK